MWGKIENKKIIKLYGGPEILKDANGTQYPISTFDSNDKLKDFNIYPCIDSNNPPIYTELYNNGGESFAWNESKSQIDKTYNYSAKKVDDENAKMEDGSDMKDDYGRVMINRGIKTILKDNVRRMQKELLSTTDQWIIRKADTGDDIPTTVTKYRSDVRTAATTMETAIDKIKDIDGAILLLTPIFNKDGTIKTPATLYDFPHEPDGMPT